MSISAPTPGAPGEIIDRLRDMLKRETPGFTNVDLNQVIRAVERIVHSDAILHGIAVELDLAADICPVNGDTVQLQQVVLNLMVNAFTAMSGTWAREVRRLIVHKFDGRTQRVTIEVQDNGAGIDREKLSSRIFEPFITSKRDGLGMGLAICRSIIDRHGGKIWAENNRDRGATFSITLPAVLLSKSDSSAYAFPARRDSRMQCEA